MALHSNREMNFSDINQLSIDAQKAREKAPDPYARKKYRPGPVLRTFEQVLDAAKRGVWIFHGDRPVHPGWYSNWSVCMVDVRLRGGHLRLAIRNKAFPLTFTATYLQSKVHCEASAWWLQCDEIPRFEESMFDLSMTSVINKAFEIARKKGHFGEVKVLFWKECPF
jgi:hypothetical protein